MFHQPHHTQPSDGADLALSRAAAERHQTLQALTAAGLSVPRRRPAVSSRSVHRLRSVAGASADRLEVALRTLARGRYLGRTEPERPAP